MVEDNELVNGGYEPTNKPGGTTFSWPKKPSNEQSSISTPTKKKHTKQHGNFHAWCLSVCQTDPKRYGHGSTLSNYQQVA